MIKNRPKGLPSGRRGPRIKENKKQAKKQLNVANGCIIFLVDLSFQTTVIMLKTNLFFLDFHLRPLGREVKFYIKDTNDFSKNLYSLPDNIILCTANAVGLYAKILYDQGLSTLRKQLDSRQKNMSLPQRL